MNLSSLLDLSAGTFPDREALVLGTTRLTYGDVDAAANQVANLLMERGIVPGDEVALMCPNLPSFSIVCFGILKAGAVVVPLNVLLKAGEVAYHLGDSEAAPYGEPLRPGSIGKPIPGVEMRSSTAPRTSSSGAVSTSIRVRSRSRW